MFKISSMLALSAACLLAPAPVFAQSALTACDAGPRLADQIGGAETLATSPLLAFDERMAAFRRLLDEHPTDPFVNRRYMRRFNSYVQQPLYDRLLPRYEALYQKNPADVSRAFLYALSIVRREPGRAASVLERLTRDMPRAPWPHLALSWIKFRVKPSDEEWGTRELEAFAAICPNSLDPEALDRIVASGSETLRRTTAARLRKQLPKRSDRPALASWPVLWQLEFQLAPGAEHDVLRSRIRDDLKRLRALATTDRDTQLDVLKQGCALTQDEADRRWAQDELLRAQPSSRAAADAAVERWAEDNPRPRRDASPEDLATFRRRNLDVSDVWIARWPNYEPAWSPRLTAVLSSDDLPPERLASLGRELLSVSQRNPDFTYGFTDPPTLSIAHRFASLGVELASVAEIVRRGLQRVSERLESDLCSHVRPAGLDDESRIRGNAQISRWLAQKTMVLVFARAGEWERARGEVETYRQEVARADTQHPSSFWSGLSGLVDAAVDARSTGVAREAIARMDATLSQERASNPTTPQQRREQALHDSSYWVARARLAEADDRRPDAIAYYLRAASLTPSDYDPVTRRDLGVKARALWTALGGTKDGLDALMPVDGPSQWSSIEKPLPSFSLEDIAGRQIQLADLAGETLFINVWATWCGPCMAELPFVQRIHETLAARQDIAVLTLNVDDNPGVVAQFLKQRGFTFPVLLARDYVEGQLKVEAIPRNWIVDSKGVLRLERQAGTGERFVEDVLATIRKVSNQSVVR